MMKDAAENITAAITWSVANRQYLETELARLRVLVQRRVLWLRRQWQPNPLQTYQSIVISDSEADRLLAGENRVEEVRFYSEDERTAALNARLAQIETQLEALRRAFAEANRPAALDLLVQLFALTPFEQNVLLLCLAPELDAGFERIYAYMQDDAAHKYATPNLALTLFGGDGDEWLAARASLLPDAPLRHFHLVQCEAEASTLVLAPLRLHARVVDYLLSASSRMDARLAQVLRAVPPAPLTDQQREWVDRLARSLQPRRWRGVNLVSARGAGKRALARALCDALGWQLLELDVTRIPAAGSDRADFLRLLEREAVLGSLSIYLNAEDVDAHDKTQRSAVADVIEQCGVFVIVGSRERWPSERALLTARVIKPDALAQRALWQQALSRVPHSVNGQLDRLIQQFDVSPSDVENVILAAEGRARLRASENEVVLDANDLWQACREYASAAMDELAQRIVPRYTWDDIVLPEDIVNQLRQVAAQVEQRARVYETWGFGAKLSRGRGISALFSGASGTGKTMAAEILANHLQLDLYRIDLSSVVSKYIGETEKNLRKAFDAAEQSGAILFFDEADALFGRRSEVKDSHDRYANVEINYLLQRMEDYRGLAILATNMKSMLDQAFLRRLRFIIDFPFPDANLRAHIWQTVFPHAAPVQGLDYAFLARLDIPGGNIKNIALNAAFLAAQEQTSIAMTHVLRAARREYAKMDRLVSETDWASFEFKARA